VFADLLSACIFARTQDAGYVFPAPSGSVSRSAYCSKRGGFILFRGGPHHNRPFYLSSRCGSPAVPRGVTKDLDACELVRKTRLTLALRILGSWVAAPCMLLWAGFRSNGPRVLPFDRGLAPQWLSLAAAADLLLPVPRNLPLSFLLPVITHPAARLREKVFFWLPRWPPPPRNASRVDEPPSLLRTSTAFPP